MNKIIPVPAGDGGPWRQQALLGRGRWDADALRDIVRDYVIGHLGDNHAVLVIDETGFLQQGKASCGVGRQYTGSAGKITNCQIGVFASYVSNKVGDNRHDPFHLFGAICPERAVGAAIIMPSINTEALIEHLIEISAMVAADSHAVLVCDGAGWHQPGRRVCMSENLTLLRLHPTRRS
jgi:hypothetical protein